jgi:transcriptional/translational regulatory protein YebC/TACO1
LGWRAIQKGSGDMDGANFFEIVKDKLESEGISFTESSITMFPENMVEAASLDKARKALSLIEALEDHDDVQNVYTNLDVSSEMMQALESE